MNLNANKKNTWEGYTLDELRAQRTLVQARIMLEEDRLRRNVRHFKRTIDHKRTQRSSTLLGRVVGALNYLDWIVLGFTAYKKLWPLLNRRK